MNDTTPSLPICQGAMLSSGTPSKSVRRRNSRERNGPAALTVGDPQHGGTAGYWPGPAVRVCGRCWVRSACWLTPKQSEPSVS